MTKRCSPEAQELIDLLTPLAGQRRVQYGPDDGVLFMLSKIIHDLQVGQIVGRGKKKVARQKTVKAHLANGARVSVPADLLAKEEVGD